MVDNTSAGNYEPGSLILMEKKHTGAAITKGDVLSIDATSHGWKTCPVTANTFGPYAIATKSYSSAVTISEVLTDGIAYVVADGSIQVGDFVMPSGTTAGQVIAYVPANIGAAYAEATAEAATQDFNHIVGRYIGEPDANDGKTVAVPADDGDLIRIVVGGGGR